MKARTVSFGASMELREIKALLALMRDFGLSELEIEDKKGKVRLVRAANSADERHRAAAAAPRGPVRAAAQAAAGLGGPVPEAGAAAAPAVGHRQGSPQ